MKIVFDDIIFWLQTSGGGSVYWYEITNGISKLNDDTTRVQYNKASRNLFLEKMVSKNVLHFDMNHFTRYLPFTLDVGMHIFHSSYYRFSRAKNAINITTVHDFTYEKFIKGIPKIIHYYQKKEALRNSDGIICVSENTKKDLLYYHPWIDENKIKIINNGLSQEYLSFKSNEEISLPLIDNLKNKKVVLFIGHRSKYKNFDVAIETVACMPNNYHLVVVGRPFNKFESRLIEQKLPNKYLLLKEIRNDELRVVYNKADCLLYPSSYEGFGIPIIEAMAMGCPVVAVNTSSIPEVSGNAGILVTKPDSNELSNAILSLNDSTFRNDIIKKGIKNAKRFSWEKAVKETFEFYNSILENKRAKFLKKKN